jgi:hypothetical protein
VAFLSDPEVLVGHGREHAERVLRTATSETDGPRQIDGYRVPAKSADASQPAECPIWGTVTGRGERYWRGLYRSSIP